MRCLVKNDSYDQFVDNITKNIDKATEFYLNNKKLFHSRISIEPISYVVANFIVDMKISLKASTYQINDVKAYDLLYKHAPKIQIVTENDEVAKAAHSNNEKFRYITKNIYAAYKLSNARIDMPCRVIHRFSKDLINVANDVNKRAYSNDLGKLIIKNIEDYKYVAEYVRESKEPTIYLKIKSMLGLSFNPLCLNLINGNFTEYEFDKKQHSDYKYPSKTAMLFLMREKLIGKHWVNRLCMWRKRFIYINRYTKIFTTTVNQLKKRYTEAQLKFI